MRKLFLNKKANRNPKFIFSAKNLNYSALNGLNDSFHDKIKMFF